jgi:hypothetical protein
MKNELRIGNYYQNNGKIETVNPNTILHLFESPRKWIQPIELTEEWLIKKFGFKTVHGLVYSLNDFELVLEQGMFRFYINGTHIDVTKVHKLQNLYYEFRNEELTIK